MTSWPELVDEAARSSQHPRCSPPRHALLAMVYLQPPSSYREGRRARGRMTQPQRRRVRPARRLPRCRPQMLEKWPNNDDCRTDWDHPPPAACGEDCQPTAAARAGGGARRPVAHIRSANRRCPHRRGGHDCCQLCHSSPAKARPHRLDRCGAFPVALLRASTAAAGPDQVGAADGGASGPTQSRLTGRRARPGCSASRTEPSTARSSWRGCQGLDPQPAARPDQLTHQRTRCGRHSRRRAVG